MKVQKNLFEWSWKDKEDFTSFTGGDTTRKVGCMSQGILCDVFVAQKTQVASVWQSQANG